MGMIGNSWILAVLFCGASIAFNWPGLMVIGLTIGFGGTLLAIGIVERPVQANQTMPMTVQPNTEVVPEWMKREIHTRQNGMCGYPGCKAPAMELHHMIPRKHGGPNTKENLIYLCANHHFMARRIK